jgi:hypothetical protein
MQYPRWIAHRKSASQVLATLMTRQANLASGLAAAHQYSGCQVKPLRARQPLQRAPRNHFRLVEPALRLLVSVQRNGDHDNRPNGHRLLQAGDGSGQCAPQNPGCRTNLLELQQVNQVAQSAFVAAVGNRSLKRRIHPLTEQAPRLATLRRIPTKRAGEVQDLATDNAVRPGQRSKGEQARFTNGKAGNADQWGTADTAVGGEKSEE